MRIAIMQPYVFPYIGYFQLINAVDRFVFYDDVNFIKQGWVNRNRILTGGKEYLFSVPVESISSFKKINETRLKGYDVWRGKFKKTLAQSYSKAPFYQNVSPLLFDFFERDYSNISLLAIDSVKLTLNYLGVVTNIIDSSAVYNNSELKGEERVLDICMKENATHYINAAGGVQLYDRERFANNGIKLNFIKSQQIVYSQGLRQEFIPFLSIIDLLMHNSKEELVEFIDKYELL
jgi:hypothetical protein